jgi:hypothetical protein
VTPPSGRLAVLWGRSPRDISAVATVLILVTGLSVVLAEGLLGGGVSRAAVVMTIAAIKLSLVGLYFMELRHAPPALTVVFHVWVVAVWGVVIGFYLAH